MARWEDAALYCASGSNDVLHFWDPVGGDRVIASAPNYRKRGDLYGTTAVWEDYRAGTDKPQIYMWDPVNGERALSPSASNQLRPKIWGDRVVWVQGGTAPSYSDGGVYMWTPQEGTTRVGAGDYAAIYQDRVVTWTNAWWEYPPGLPGVFHPGYLNEWTPQGGFRTILQHDKSTSALEIWGDLVVGDHLAWEPLHGFTDYSLSAPSSFPSVYQDQVAWFSGDNVYLSTMVPEPSALSGVIAGLGILGALTRRRRKERR